MKYLILSPFPKDGTKNSGDNLIVKSLIKLLKYFEKNKNEYKVVSIANSTKDKEKVFEEINIIDYDKLLVPAFRITIKGQTDQLKLRLDYILNAIMKDIPVFLIGCSWCVFPGIESQTNLKIDAKEKAMLRYIVKDKNSFITSRDLFTKKLLENNGIKSSLTGDIALFDIDKIDSKFIIQDKIKSIAITIPHNSKWYNSCFLVKKELETRFNLKVYLCSHQYFQNNKSYRELYGDSKILDFYKSIDMHIGFRLHGHIWFIRNRKPSILLAEDGRGYGYLKTFNDCGIHATPEYILKYSERTNNNIILSQLNKNTEININKIISLFEESIKNKFKQNQETCKKIDSLFNNKFKDIILKILEDNNNE